MIATFPVASAKEAAVSPSRSEVTSAPRVHEGRHRICRLGEDRILKRRRTIGIQAVRINTRTDDCGDKIVTIARRRQLSMHRPMSCQDSGATSTQ